MWFRFPKGTTQISVANQQFVSEANDAAGDYFRAPDHFAPIILDLPGFQRVLEPPEGAPEDLPTLEPQVSDAISQLTDQNEAYKASIDDLRAINQDLSQQVEAAAVERDGYKKDLEDAEAELSQLKAAHSKLQASHAEVTKAHEEATADLADAEKEVASLKSQLPKEDGNKSKDHAPPAAHKK